MRQFALTNANGERISLCSEDLFFHTISGLGYSLETDTRRVGDKFIILNKKVAQSKISGSMVYGGENPYDTYRNFVKFCSYQPLTMEYIPNTEVTYYREVIPSKIDKTEIQKYGVINDSIEFTALGPWYVPATYKYNKEGSGIFWSSGIGTHSFPVTWGKENHGQMNMMLDGVTKPSCIIKIYGPCENPVWYHYVNNKKYAEGKVSVTIPESQYLKIDGINYPVSIGLYKTANDTLVSDEYQNSDWSTDRFVTLQPGNNRIVVYDEQETIPTYSVEAHIEYESI